MSTSKAKRVSLLRRLIEVENDEDFLIAVIGLMKNDSHIDQMEKFLNDNPDVKEEEVLVEAAVIGRELR